MTVWGRRGKTPEGYVWRWVSPLVGGVAPPRSELPLEKNKNVKLIHFNIFCLDAFLWLHGHVSQNAFTAFPIISENRTGDGNKGV